MRNLVLRQISDQALRHAAAVIFPTELARRLITQRSPTRAPQFVVPYGYELPTVPSPLPQARRRILCVSSVLPYKNLPLALDAFGMLKRKHAFEGELIIVGVSGVAGSGRYRREIEARIPALGLAGDVRMIPPVAPDELAGLYCGSDCLLMPSIEETFGIPLIEAMGLGTPIAAAEVSGRDLETYFIPFREYLRGCCRIFLALRSRRVRRSDGANTRSQQASGVNRRRARSRCPLLMARRSRSDAQGVRFGRVTPRADRTLESRFHLLEP